MKIELKTATLVDIGTNKVYTYKNIQTTDWKITYISLKSPTEYIYAFDNKFKINKTK